MGPWDAEARPCGPPQSAGMPSWVLQISKRRRRNLQSLTGRPKRAGRRVAVCQVCYLVAKCVPSSVIALQLPVCCKLCEVRNLPTFATLCSFVFSGGNHRELDCLGLPGHCFVHAEVQGVSGSGATGAPVPSGIAGSPLLSARSAGALAQWNLGRTDPQSERRPGCVSPESQSSSGVLVLQVWPTDSEPGSPCCTRLRTGFQPVIAAEQK